MNSKTFIRQPVNVIKGHSGHRGGRTMKSVPVLQKTRHENDLTGQPKFVTQGRDIHVAPEKEQHLPHEAWHVVQQKQGRILPTMQMKGGVPKELELRQPNTSTVQRLGPNVGASSPALVIEYNNLLLSTTFQELNQIVTAIQDIILIDSSLIPGQPTDYDPATHTIRVPLNNPLGAANPLTQVRERMIFEMHNASTKGAKNRINTKLFGPAPGPGATGEEKRIYPYKIAAGALSIEWEEWILIAEHDMRIQAINADPAMAPLGIGPHVHSSFGGMYTVPDKGWFNFLNYLKVQIAGGHTAAYDPNVAAPKWKGKRILDIIEKSSDWNYLIITQKQVKDWLSGKSKKIKSIDNNPFNKISTIKKAAEGDS